MVSTLVSSFSYAKPLTLLTYNLTFLLISSISIGSYFSISNWHKPINSNLLKDFIANHHFYISLFTQKNYFLVIFLFLILLFGVFLILNLFYPYHHAIIQHVKFKLKGITLKKEVPVITLSSIFFVLIFSVFFNHLKPRLLNVKKTYVVSDPLAHFYYSSIMRHFLKNKVAHAEKQIAKSLTEKYSRNTNDKTPSKNIILITIDALRSDYLPCYGFSKNVTPFLDSFLKNNKHVIVKSPLAVCNYSVGGISSILDGKLSDQIGVKNLSIQNYLHHWGYKSNFFLSGNHSGFGYMDLIYGNTINHYFEGSLAIKYSSNDDRMITPSLQSFFKKEKWEKESNFFWFHLMSVHVTSKREIPFQQFRPSNISDILSENKEYLKEKYTNNYMNGILQMDDVLKGICSQLSEKSILDNATIIITSDHGESLGEHGFFAHGNTISYPEFNIPIIIIDDDLPSIDNISFGSQIDIAPTILDLLDLPKPDVWEGNSLFEANTSSIINLSSANHYELGVAIPFQNTWLALVEKENIREFLLLDKSLTLSDTVIPDSLKTQLINALNNRF